MAEVARLGHRPGLDGLRGIAVLVVIVHHAYPQVLPGGYFGVDVFFVLSGFLITTLLLERGGTLARFYWRRCRRLFPALAAFLVVAGVYHQATSSYLFDVHVDWVPWVYLTNVQMAFGQGEVAWGHIWSLAMEEQFYLLWPPLLLVLARRSRRLTVAVTGGLVCAATGWTVVLSLSGASAERIAFGPDTRSVGLLAGCLVAELRIWRLLPVIPRSAGPAAAAMLTASVAGAKWTSGPTGFLVAAGFASVVVLASLDWGWLGWGPLARIGAVSYAMYLWHPFLLEVVDGPRWFAAVLSWPVAELSMRLIEAPALRSRLAVETRQAEHPPRTTGVGVRRREDAHRVGCTVDLPLDLVAR